MKSHRFVALLLMVSVAPLAAFTQTIVVGGSSGPGPPQPISLDDYPKEMARLQALVNGCGQRTGRSACDPARARDLEVATPFGKRAVGYQWLRETLRHAADASDKPAADAPNDSTRVSKGDSKDKQKAWKEASAGLQAASSRLSEDMASQPSAASARRDTTKERRSLDTILGSGDYSQAKPLTLWERLREELLKWLQTRLNSVTRSSASQMIINLLLTSLIVTASAILVWWFARRVRDRSSWLPVKNAPHPSAPSAQDWNRWLDQGQAFAREKRFREAIHNVYWSAISCLESRGLWPADRARTPREYLRLLAAKPEVYDQLYLLTRSFEHTWYGNSIAGQQEFDEACRLLERLASR